MVGRTLKSLISRRRRAGEEEGEDEEGGPVLVADSQSEGSVMTELESEDGDMDDSVTDEQPSATVQVNPKSPREQTKSEGPENAKSTGAAKKRKQRKKPVKKSSKEPTPNGSAQSSFRVPVDTDAMMNGLNIDDRTHTDREVLDFENQEDVGSGRNRHSGSAPNVGEQRRRDHQEYRRQRDSNPAFIPNRGGFYMHDSRNHADSRGPGPSRGTWQGRGKPRTGPPHPTDRRLSPPLGGPGMPSTKIDQGPWRHDLHDTVNPDLATHSVPANSSQDQLAESVRLFGRPSIPQGAPSGPAVISFSSTTLVGKVNLRVMMAGMKAAISYHEVPVRHYTRLPNHRPPLRSDKPVRVSLPNNPPRYIFPSPDRSFIFIPRQMRPNQQGFGRLSHNNRSASGMGYSSRRTSMYGGSMYSASIAPSRRPSMASQVGREPIFSPAASVASGYQSHQYRPVVRMPGNFSSQSLYSGATTPAQPFSGYQTPTMPPMQNFPPPQQPTFQGTPTTNVQHPRPQKAISVSGIDSPALIQQSSSVPPEGQQQPFYSQLPAHMQTDPTSAGFNTTPSQPPYFNMGAQHYNYAPTPSHVNTPNMAGIPENAVHAPPFQGATSGMPYGQAFFPNFPQSSQAQGPYGFWSPQSTGFVPSMALPPGQRELTLPPHLPPAQEGQTSQQPPLEDPQQISGDAQLLSQPQSGFVAYEDKGMVFYRPASEATHTQGQDTSSGYQPAETFTPSYAMPPGSGLHAQQPNPSFYNYPAQTLGAMFYPTAGMPPEVPGSGQP